MNSLIEEGSYYYGQIQNEFPFDWKDQIIAVLEGRKEVEKEGGGAAQEPLIGKKEILAFFEKYLYRGNGVIPQDEERKSVAVMIFSSETKAEYEDLQSNHSGSTSSKSHFLNLPIRTMTSLDQMVDYRKQLPFHPIVDTQQIQK